MTSPEHSSLPLRDYDHLSLPALAQRIRSLAAEEITGLLAFERNHANRPAAIEIFENRLAELSAGESPTPGRQQSGPDWPEPPAGGSRVSPASAGPPSYPPPHGTPDQPARPKADRGG